MTEDLFFAKLFPRLPDCPDSVVIPPGDDCAAVRWHNHTLMLLAVDQVVGNRHYISSGANATPPELAGRKLLARNLSDIAAMGGKPLFCLLGAAFKKGKQEAWLNAFYDGIINTAREYGVAMIGGDYVSTEHDDVASLTIIGEVADHQVLRRSGAQPGDWLCLTGACGNSFTTGHHLSFQPRCQEGAWLAERHYAKAMIDISDGLLLDASRICRMSHCGLQLNLPEIPLRTADTTLRQALSDGEDFELLFAVANATLSTLLTEWPFPDTRLTPIGRFTTQADIVDSNGHKIPISGWDHLQN
ncbi:MAG: thiamine-phosphate kinase [Lentisphaeria bacterium]